MKNKLKEAKIYLESLGYKICYIGIYGSQNYGLDIYTDKYKSDIDYKAVCIPSLRDLINNSKPVSTSYEFQGGLIDLKDIRVWTEALVKCNPAYIETLYSKYCWYTEDYGFIIREKENLISEMGAFLLKASYGMILEKIKAFSHPYPSIKDKIDRFGYDPKQLHHIQRLYYLMKKYVETGKFDMINNNDVTKQLKEIKIGKLSLSDAIQNREMYSVLAKTLRDNYLVEPTFLTKGKIIKYSKDLIYNQIQNEKN